MPNNNESTMKWKVDITQLKAAMQEAKRSINQANAEFKTATAGMDKWSKSTSGLEAKLEQLNKLLPAQKRQLEVLEAQYKDTVKRMGENSSAAADLKIKIEEQKATITKTETSISKYNDQLSEMKAKEAESESATSKLTKTIEEQEKQLVALKKAHANAVLEYGENSKEAKDLARQIEDLSGELANNKTKLNNAETAADQFDKSLENVEDQAGKTSGGFTVMAGALADLVANGIRMAIGAMKDFVSETIEVGKAFDSSMSQVAAVSGATGDDLDKLREKAKEMGANTKFSASEAADAFNYMAMAGWKTEDMLGGIEGVLSLAAAGNTDLARTSDIVTDALTAFGEKADQAGRLADIMAAASSNANTNVELMGETFKYVAPVAGAMGYSMEDVSVAIGLMANAGIKGSQSGTALRSILSRLAAPPKEAAEAMDALGISITNSDGTMKPFSEVIGILRTKFDGLSEAEQTAYAKHIAGQEAMSGLLSIVNAAPEDLDKLTSAIDNSNGAAEKMSKIMQDNLGGDLTQFGSKLEGVQIALYEKFEPALRSGVEVLSELLDVVNWVIDHSELFVAALAAMATGIGTYVAYTTALKVMKEGWMALEIVQKAVAASQAALNAVMAMNPIGLVIAAIAALVTAFVILWNKSEAFRNFWIGLWEKIKEAASVAKDKISEWIEIIKQKIQEFSDKAGEIKDSIVEKWENIKSKTEDLKNKVVEFFEGIKTGIQEKIDSAKEKVSEAVENIKELLSFSGLKKKVEDLFESIKEKITSPIEKAKELVTNAVEKIKGIFPISMGKIFSGIKLPHFKISGGEIPWGIGGMGTKPSVDIEWYARGGVFDKGARLAGIGENGAEAVVPLENNTKWINRVAKELVRQINAISNVVRGNVHSMNGTGDVVNTQNVTFNQTINSPKAVDRLTLYRETNDLLFSAKVRIGNV